MKGPRTPPIVIRLVTPKRRHVRGCTNLAAARGYARSVVSKHPDIRDGYATKDGLSKLYCTGCTLEELFPDYRAGGQTREAHDDANSANPGSAKGRESVL